jgi:hypothetical protein
MSVLLFSPVPDLIFLDFFESQMRPNISTSIFQCLMETSTNAAQLEVPYMRGK